MDVLALIAQARAAGLTVRADDDRLIVNGPRSAEAIVMQLRDHKLAVLALLRRDGDAPSPVPRPPTCVDDAHGTLGWWHAVDGLYFCTAWACQHGTPPPPEHPGARCGDQSHHHHWHLLADGIWACVHADHAD
jgi:hypothetical protein